MRLSSSNVSAIFIFTNLMTEKEIFTKDLPSRYFTVGKVINFHEQGQPNNKEFYVKKIDVQALDKTIVTHVKLMPL